MGYGGFGLASSDHIIFLDTEKDVKNWAGDRSKIKMSGEQHAGMLGAGGGFESRPFKCFNGYGKQRAGLYISQSLLVKAASLDNKKNRKLYGKDVCLSDVQEGLISLPPGADEELAAIYDAVAAAAKRAAAEAGTVDGEAHYMTNAKPSSEADEEVTSAGSAQVKGSLLAA